MKLKNFKRFLAVFMATLVLLTSLSVSLATAETEGFFQYEIVNEYDTDFVNGIADTYAVITKYNGSESAVSVPSALGGYPVKRVEYSAFKGNAAVTSVTIPDSVLSIGDNAFENCVNLTQLNLPNTLQSIGNGILSGTPICEDSKYWDNNLLYIGKYLVDFDNSETVTEITIKEGTELIAALTFGFSELENVKLPDSLKYIGDMAFAYCENIKSIDLENKTIDNEISFDYLIIATGRRHRLLNLENEDKLLGRGISTCALCDGNFYRDKEVIVVGGGSSALTESLYLAGICKKVTIIHRRNSFSAEEYLIDKVNNTKNIKTIYNANIIKYNTKDNIITSVTLDTEEEVQTDGVFLSIGSIPNSELFNVEKENNYIKVDNNYETNIKNIYAIGDVIKKDYYQLINASNEGMMVALNIIDKEK